MAALRRRPHARALLGYLALAAAFYAPILLGLRWFPTGDFTDHFLPFNVFQRAELLAGRLPVWNPFTFSGHPFLADIQAAVFYPVSNLVLGLTLPWSDLPSRLYWLEVEAVLHVALAGFFTYLLAHDLVRNRAAAFLAGCIFAFSGYLTGYPALQTAVLRTAIWLPLVLWCLGRAFAGRERWRWWIAAAVAYAVAFLGGHPQTFLYVSYCVAGWIVLLLVVDPRAAAPQGAQVGEARALPTPVARLRGATIAQVLPKIVAFYAIFLGLAAAQLWPSLEFTSLSVRANMDYASASGGFPLRDTWQMVTAGSVSQFSPLFVGLAALGLALLAAARAPGSMVRRKNPAPPHSYAALFFFLLVALAALFASYGNHAFLYRLLYRWAPGWSMFRGQERAAYLVAFGLSMAAAYGAAAFLALPRSGRRRAGLAWAVAAAAALVAIAAALGVRPEASQQVAMLRGRLVGGGVIAVILALALLPLRRRVLAGVLLATVLFELFAANFATNLSERPVLPRAEALALQSMVQPGGAPGGGQDAPARVHNEEVVIDDYGMLVRVEDVSGSSPLRLARYDALLGDFPKIRLWQLTGTQYVLTPREELYVPSELVARMPAPSVAAAAGDGAASQPSLIYRLSDDHPRAWIVTAIRTADDNAALPLLGDLSLNLAETALLPSMVNGAGRPIGLEDGQLASPGTNEVLVKQIAPGELQIHVNSERGGYLVVSENWLPGWQARVHAGERWTTVPVLRTNLTFLGLRLYAGEQTVELRYRPASVRGGLLISGLTVILVAGALVLRRVRMNLPGHAKDLPGLGDLGGLAVRWFGAPALVLLALALRVFRLGYQELRVDEALGRLFSLEPLPALMGQTIELAEPHPVASYALQGAWVKLAGHAEYALRFTSAWFGVLAVALVYRLARRLGLGRRVAALAAALLAISPYAIWHSQDAAMYSMSLALTLASTVLMLEALAQTPQRMVRIVRWAAYVAVTWLALQTHICAAHIIVAQNVFIVGRAIANRAERRHLAPWLAAQAATLLLCLPWLIAARASLTPYAGNGDAPGFAAMWLRLLGVLAAGETLPAGQRAAAGIVIALLAFIGAARLARSIAGRRALWLLLPCLLAPLLIAWAGALSRAPFNGRTIIVALPALLLMVAGVAGRSKKHASAQAGPTSPVPPASPRSQDDLRAGVTTVLIASLCALLLVATLVSLLHYYGDPEYSKSRGWRQLAAVMDRHTSGWPAAKVRVAQTGPDATLWYYYGGAAEQGILPPAPNNEAGAREQVNDWTAQGVQRVVIAVRPRSDRNDSKVATAALEQQYKLISVTPVGDWRLHLYERAPAALAPVGATFANQLRLEGIGVPSERLAPGDVLTVYLAWSEGGPSLSGSEKITLQLLDAANKVMAQVDEPFDGTDLVAEPAMHSLPLPRDLPGGSYRLILALYDPASEGAPRIPVVGGTDHVVLKEWTVDGMGN